MAFVKYTGTNLAQGSLNVGISAASGSLTLKTGEGALFPTAYPFILKIEKIVTLAVTKREFVICTNRSGDTFTITRSGEYCPADDTALTQTNTAFAFDADDVVTLVLSYKMIEDIQTETARLETDKLDKNGELRTGNGAWKIPYTNGSGNEVELALPTAGKVLTGNGTTSAPTFETPTVDIDSLDAVGSPFASDDYIIFYDKSATANKKHLSKASTTNEGLVEMATDAEALSGSDEERYVNSKQVGFSIVPSTTVVVGPGGTKNLYIPGVPYAKYYDTTILKSGTYTITFILRVYGASNNAGIRGRIYKNGVAWGTEQSLGAGYDLSATYTENLAFLAGDTCELWLTKTDSYNYNTWGGSLSVCFATIPNNVIGSIATY